jgi:hypothetical protein
VTNPRGGITGSVRPEQRPTDRLRVSPSPARDPTRPTGQHQRQETLPASDGRSTGPSDRNQHPVSTGWQEKQTRCTPQQSLCDRCVLAPRTNAADRVRSGPDSAPLGTRASSLFVRRDPGSRSWPFALAEPRSSKEREYVGILSRESRCHANGASQRCFDRSAVLVVRLPLTKAL